VHAPRHWWREDGHLGLEAVVGICKSFYVSDGREGVLVWKNAFAMHVILNLPGRLSIEWIPRLPMTWDAGWRS
jgi:hypothetical protein